MNTTDSTRDTDFLLRLVAVMLRTSTAEAAEAAEAAKTATDAYFVAMAASSVATARAARIQAAWDIYKAGKEAMKTTTHTTTV